MQQNLEGREPLLIEPFGLYGNNSSTVFDSMKSHELTHIDGGRWFGRSCGLGARLGKILTNFFKKIIIVFLKKSFTNSLL